MMNTHFMIVNLVKVVQIANLSLKNLNIEKMITRENKIHLEEEDQEEEDSIIDINRIMINNTHILLDLKMNFQEKFSRI